ncbi:MAG: cytochrome ubiquinol oxidase subunit I [Phycisphaeraceae bacterium]|nr:cytochrome ubiquinol oxidase subunit I [Phycisphaeraceae bacterium]
MDVALLSRIQFALTIMFHYLFPPLTIGMSIVLVYLEGMYLRTREPIYETAARFWTQLFAVTFAVGVATGIVMEFQFGLNWAVYSRFVGDVFGSALAAEGIFAFFLESGFLAILVFGWDRVSAGFHFFATCMVSLGSIFSSVWITVANSWQQTPAGHVIRDHVVNGQTFQRAEITDFWAMVFNPSSLHRLVHVWIGAFILGAFFVMSISAWYLLKKKHEDFARRSFSGALLLATVASLAQLASGHLQAKNVAEHQPAKMAAFEGLYKNEATGGSPLYLWGWPSDAQQTVKGGLAIPGGLSRLIYDDWNKPVPSLAELEPVWGKPPVWISFQSYHVMVALGVFFIVLTLFATLLRLTGVLFKARWLLWVFVLAVIPAYVANQLGWVAAEVGRQPWIVYPKLVNGVAVEGLRTNDAISEVVTAPQVLSSIILFSVIYALLFVLWIKVLNHKIQHGPQAVGVASSTSLDKLRQAVTNRPSHGSS